MPDTQPMQPDAQTTQPDIAPAQPVASSLRQVVGALIFSSPVPIGADAVRKCLRDMPESEDGSPTPFRNIQSRDVLSAILDIQLDLERLGLGVSLQEVAGGYRFQTQQGCGRWVRSLLKKDKPALLSRPSLETLAIIAYRQPVARSEIEGIRGVAADHSIRQLMELHLVRIVGRSDLPGRPFLYGTTPLFLEHFGLKDIGELKEIDPTLQTRLQKDSGKDSPEAEKAEPKAKKDKVATEGFAAIFDLDGVIVSTDKYHRQAWQALADELEIPFTEEQAQATRGVDRMASLEIVLGENSSRFSDEEKRTLAERKNNIYKELVKGITPADALPGVDTLLPALKERGVKIAIGSASKNAMPVLENMGIAQMFDAIVTGHDFTHGKPAPDVFLTAAERLGADPAQCVVFEDAAAGIQAAHAGGMKAVGIGDPEIVKGCDRFAKTLADISVEQVGDLFDR